MSEESNQGSPDEKRESSRRRRRRSSGGSDGSKQGNQGNKGGSSGRRRRRRRSRGKKKSQSGGEKSQESKSGDSNKGRSGSKRSNRRSNRRRSNRKKQSHRNRGSRQNRSKKRSRRKTPVRKLKTPESKLGGREPLLDPSAITHEAPSEMTAFELFCALHLGITENNNFRKQSLGEIAQRFRTSTEEVKKALKNFGLDRETVRRSSFDMSLAELDMKVAPNGLDKKELARPLFEDFLVATPDARKAIEALESQEESGEGSPESTGA